MTRKDFELVARVIREGWSTALESAGPDSHIHPADVDYQYRHLVGRFVDEFTGEFPRFAPSRFVSACEPDRVTID